MSKHWFIAKLIEKYTKNKKLGLDVGIGRDNWQEFKKSEIIGVDKYKNSKVNTILDLEGNLPFRDNSFDIALGINSFNFVDNSRQLLSEINRVLKEDGILVCSVDNEKSTSHPHVWNEKYLNRVLDVTGFQSIMTLKERFYAKWYNRTSVYALAVVKKSKTKEKSVPKYCIKCGKQLNSKWEEDEVGNLFHTKCPPEEPKTYARSYSVETTHPDQ